MLPSDAFLRNVPTCLDLKQRMTLQAIAFSLDGMSYAYEQIKQHAAEIVASDLGNIKQEQKIRLFSHAWSMVDRIHMLRTLLRTLSVLPGGALDEFIRRHEAATQARNYLDHIHQNIDNLSKSSKTRPPVFGSMNFCAIDEKHLRDNGPDGKVLTGCRVITLMAGSMTHQHVWMVADHIGAEQIEVPVGRFQLSAYDYTVKLTEAFFDADKVAARFESKMRSDVEEGVKKLAAEQGLDAEQLLKETGGDFITVAEMEFLSGSDADGEKSPTGD